MLSNSWQKVKNVTALLNKNILLRGILKSIKPWHVIAFWIGLMFDTVGTLTMRIIAQSGTETSNQLILTVHGATGVLAIALMIIHALWATIVLLGIDEKKKANFHRFSIVVWSIWLIPYLAGMLMGML